MDSKDVSSIAIIPQFYAGREVFITGATGFIGKVLVERLLSTCPDIGRLHLLMRVKRGEAPEARLQKLKESPVFDVLRNDYPDRLNKLSPITGDINKLNLGFTEKTIADLNNVRLILFLLTNRLITMIKITLLTQKTEKET
ncbi:unnamed protein product [Diatraea saccharalis]|uniref:Fatty acyl-CoA reductase n=1 Tax=Diatraea saccharalis TaxID=40085 RepID=A0A9N9R7U7_9NEOP|nr:unnamed protein product [Diatraea saccharalis]